MAGDPGNGSSAAEAAGGRFSWLKIADPANWAPDVAQLQQDSLQRLGFIRSFLRLPFGPGRLALYQGYLDRLMRAPDGLLSPLERELLALVTSVENRCEVCILSHAAALKKHGLDADTVDTMTLAWRRAPLAPRHLALANFASRLTLAPGEVDESLLDGLRSAGLSEAQVFEAVQVVAIYNSNNRINNAVGMIPNAQSRPGYRAPG
jgi:uncharacterized peroxidase-related enzyme